MNGKVDVNKLQSLISQKEKEQVQKEVSSGVGGVRKKRGDQFLSELLQAKNMGIQNESTEVLKKIADKTDVKDGKKQIDSSLSEHINVNKTNNNGGYNKPQQPNNQFQRLSPQDKQRMIQEGQKLQNRGVDSGFGDALQKFGYGSGNNNMGGYGSNVHNNGGYLTEEQLRQLKQQQGTYNQTQQPMGGGSLNEQAKVVMNEFLQNNFSDMFLNAMKNTILETYENERVREALSRNRDTIKDVVIETIKELQERQKLKKGR